jgi:hypothetical protein
MRAVRTSDTLHDGQGLAVGFVPPVAALPDQCSAIALADFEKRGQPLGGLPLVLPEEIESDAGKASKPFRGFG